MGLSTRNFHFFLAIEGGYKTNHAGPRSAVSDFKETGA